MAATISPAIRARSGAGNIWRNRFIAMSFGVGRTGPRRTGSGGRERMLPGGPEGRHAPSGAVALNLLRERGGDMQPQEGEGDEAQQLARKRVVAGTRAAERRDPGGPRTHKK